MKAILKALLIFILVLVVGIPCLVFYGYSKSGYVGVETDLSKSALLAQKPVPFSEALTIKVVTFNIQDLWVVGWNRPARMRHIGRVLTGLDPDIVGFQESFIDKEREILLNALDKTRLQYHQYYPSGLVGSGVLICSAWPIRETFFHRYAASPPARRIWEGDYWAGKGVGLARIETPAGMLDFFDTHAQAGYGRAEYRELRRRQMAELAIFMNQSRTGTSPALLVGDMNCGIGAIDYETAVREAGLVRLLNIETGIDHIHAAKNTRYNFEVLDTVPIDEKVTEGGKTFSLSDHTGYMSTIRITPGQQK
jgi:endonuclease/exonuclease/phosphatase family metal-dependent hydrolase